MTLYGKIFAVCLISLAFASCSAGEDDRILEYRTADARFTVTFPSAYGDVVCDGVRSGGRTTLTVREPQRSMGITVSAEENFCTVSAGDTEISLSEEAAEGLTDVIETMYAPLSEPIEAARTADGENTVVTTPTGVLYLDETLLPCKVECQTWNGEVRTVKIENYVVDENE